MGPLTDGHSVSRKDSAGFVNICRGNRERVLGLLWKLLNICIRESVEMCLLDVIEPVLASKCIILRTTAIESSSFRSR